MSYSNEYEHIRRMFWDGTEPDAQSGFVCYELNREGIKHSLFRALKDFTPRTEKKASDEPVASTRIMLAELENKGFLDELHNYFLVSSIQQTEFDQWHHKMCLKFIKILTDAGIRKTISYGKAQKIVNMTMKTIYCLNGVAPYAEKHYFDYCHMPLDSYILEWFRIRIAEVWYNHTVRDDKSRIKMSTEGGPLPKWARIDFLPDSLYYTFDDYHEKENLRTYNDYYHYMYFVTMIREYLQKEDSAENPYYGLTPLQAEFYIWPEIQWEIAAKSLAQQDLLHKLLLNSGLVIDNASIISLCQKLKTQLDQLSTFYKS